MEEIVTRHVDDCAWIEGTENEDLRWMYLVDSTEMASHGLSTGIIEVAVGGELPLHHHRPQEIYMIRAGQGLFLKADGTTAELRRDSVVYIPPNEKHGLRNTGDIPLEILWIFPTDCWQEIEYFHK